MVLVWCAASASYAEPLAMQQPMPGIYVHHGAHEDIDVGYSGDICNIGFVVGNKGVAVIDTGGSLKVGQRLREAVRQITDLPILYVINTHIHPDHVFGNAAFLQDKPQFVGHHKLAATMAQREDAYMRGQERWLGLEGAGSVLISPTLAVQDTLSLDLGGRTLSLAAHPTAHTTTDLTVFDQASATLWSGDLLFIERTPSIDGDIKGWIQVLEQLRTLPAQTVVPGHGPVTRDLISAVDNEKRYLSTLLTDIRSAIKHSKTLTHTMDHAAQSERGNWVLFDIVNRRNINIVFPALEWE
jgi:quinoprotein relay system zinc metallohydrolase 2